MASLNQEKFLNEINEKWTSKKCPMCNHNHWNISPHLVAPVTLGENGDIQLGGNILPLAALVCNHCGNVLFVNPIAIGAMDTTDSK